MTFAAFVLLLACGSTPANACARDAATYATTVEETAGAYGLDPVRLLAVLRVEHTPRAAVAVTRTAAHLARWWSCCDRRWSYALRGHHYHTGCHAPDADGYASRVRSVERSLRRRMARGRPRAAQVKSSPVVTAP